MTLPSCPQRTTLSFAFSYVERALLEGLAVRQFTQVEMREVIDFFGSAVECVYCGARPVERWDHLVAVNNGGHTVIGNMVPACKKCDDSKRAIPFEVWAFSNSPGSPQSRGVADLEVRVRRISEYATHFAYRDAHPYSLLSPDRARRLDELRSKIAGLRVELEEFLRGT